MGICALPSVPSVSSRHPSFCQAEHLVSCAYRPQARAVMLTRNFHPSSHPSPLPWKLQLVSMSRTFSTDIQVIQTEEAFCARKIITKKTVLFERKKWVEGLVAWRDSCQIPHSHLHLNQIELNHWNYTLPRSYFSLQQPIKGSSYIRKKQFITHFYLITVNWACQ